MGTRGGGILMQSKSVLDELTNIIWMLKEDEHMKSVFVEILSVGSYSQQVRVSKLKAAIEKLNPPQEVMRFLALLSDDKLAHAVLQELKR